MMEAARTSETSVDNYLTRQYIPEDNSELHTRRRENLKSHNVSIIRRRSSYLAFTLVLQVIYFIRQLKKKSREVRKRDLDDKGIGPRRPIERFQAR
jgi:hypothetical protein